MSVTTLLRYLIGDRESILGIASSRHALWIGFLFVLSAGFAREYDGEDLWHEPFYLVIPVAASLASSLVLFGIAYGIAALKGEPWRAFFPRYLSFLGLFWMTAPLAWLYAVPYERFLSPLDSTCMNLLTLGVVSLWRVALMVHVLRVVFDYSLVASLCLVMLFADAVALVLVSLLPIPLIDIMGGLRLTEREEVTRAVALVVLQVGGCSLPLWILLGAFHIYDSKPRWQVAGLATGRPAAGLVALVLASLLIWVAILPLTQPEQQRRREVERAFMGDDFTEALTLLSAYPLNAYPPHWQPPEPREDFYLSKEKWITLVEYLGADTVAPWVREHYIARLRAEFLHRRYHGGIHTRRLGEALEQLPEGRALLDELELLPSREIIDGLKGREKK